MTTLAPDKVIAEIESLRAKLAEAEAMYADQRYAYNDLKKFYGKERSISEKLERGLAIMIDESLQHLDMYERSYKRAPYDTGIFIQLYCKDALEKIAIAREALKEARELRQT